MATRAANTARRGAELAEAPARPATKQQILKTAMEMFAQYGFEATSLRRIAAGVGIEAGSLYNHIASKQDLLFELITTATDDLISHLEAALADDKDDPVDRLATAVWAHVVYYCVNQRQAMVGDRELRALTPQNFAKTRKQRRRYEALFIDILDDGVQQGVFREIDTHIVTYGLLGLGRNVALWYRPGGRLSPEEIADIFVGMILRSVLTFKELKKRDRDLA